MRFCDPAAATVVTPAARIPWREAQHLSENSQLSTLRVMVVDDDDSMRMLVGRMLQRIGIESVVEAAGGEEALALLQTAAPVDLVICDWNMPGMSGIELFTRVAAFRPDLFFLLVTGRDDDVSREAARNAGVSGYLVKPISREMLRDKITSLLAGKRAAAPLRPPA